MTTEEIMKKILEKTPQVKSWIWTRAIPLKNTNHICVSLLNRRMDYAMPPHVLEYRTLKLKIIIDEPIPHKDKINILEKVEQILRSLKLSLTHINSENLTLEFKSIYLIKEK